VGLGLKLACCIILFAVGVACGWHYFLRPILRDVGEGVTTSTERPWRRVGAGICLVLGVMFPLGVYRLDALATPRVFLAYWGVIVILVCWLCVVALRDLAHTRHVLQSRRSRRNRSGDCDGGRRADSQGPDS